VGPEQQEGSVSKLRRLHLDDTVCVPQSKAMGDGPLHDTRDSCFHVNDGWDIRETLPGVFTITNDLMGARSVTIGGYGYSYEREAEQLAVTKIDPEARTVTFGPARDLSELAGPRRRRK
jgi:hypothetical protein